MAVSSVGPVIDDVVVLAGYFVLGFFVGLNFRDAVDWLLLQLRGTRVRG